MSRVRSRGNKSTELRLLSLLKGARIIGWRRHLPLPGSPDFVFKAAKVAVFVDGCFWHGCPKCYKEPRANASFWREKISYNKRLDRRKSRQLRKLGWSVLRIREHSFVFPSRIVTRIQNALAEKATSPRFQ